MAVPFRKVSNTRGRKRRTHYKISENATVKCPKCGAEVRPHRVCLACGTYKGKEVTVFASGMGMPSIGIYLYELFKFYDVQKVIRVGSCGAYSPDLNLLDTLLVEKSYTEGNFAYALTGKETHISEASYSFNKILEEVAEETVEEATEE